MEKIYSWVKANKLSLNIDKTNFMLFIPKHFSRSMGNIYINGTCIIELTETKFLGVIIDYKLNWSSHIMNINKKIAKGIGIILKDRAHLSTLKFFILEKFACIVVLIVFFVIVQSSGLTSVWFREKLHFLKNLLVSTSLRYMWAGLVGGCRPLAG